MLVYLFLGTLSSSLLSLVGKNIPSGKLCLNIPTLLMVIPKGKKKDVKERRKTFHVLFQKEKQ